jgi:hypothetical protein
VRRSPSRSTEAAAAACLAALLALATPSAARAQACCAGASALGTGRLAPHEDALAGVALRTIFFHGSMRRDGTFAGAPTGTTEIGFEQSVVGTFRVLRHGQLSAILPFVETYRSVPGRSDLGGGIGDVQLAARYDFLEPGASPVWPGIALSWSLTLPTGVATESAKSPLATDATGTGAVAASGQLLLERSFGDAFVQAAGGAEWRSPREVAGLHTQRGPAFSALGAAGYSFDNGVVAALTVAYRAELDARLEGARVPDSGRELLRAGLSTGYSLSDDWRIQGSVLCDVPAAPFSRNEPMGASLSFTLLRSAW